MRHSRSSRLKWLLDPSDETIRQLVQGTLGDLRAYQGRTFRELHDAMEELNRQEAREAHRRIRLDVAALLTEGHESDLPENLSPSELRQFVFSSVWEHGNGFVTSHVDLFSPSAGEYFRNAAAHFKLPERDIERYFYADTPEEKIVSLAPSMEALAPEEIIASVNLWRLRRLLRSAASLDVLLPASVQDRSPYVGVLLSMKRNRLMGDVTGSDSWIRINLQGPMALFYRSTAYGNRLSSFAASLLGECDHPWRLTAEILHPRGNTVEKISLDESLRSFFPPSGGQHQEEQRSSDERAFKHYFERYSKGSDWNLVYEGNLLVLEDPVEHTRRIMVPDFTARNLRSGKEVLIEIVGYWRKEYLERKMAKVRLLRDRQLILIINKNLAVERSGEEPPSKGLLGLYTYSNRTELKSIAQYTFSTLEKHR